MAEIAFPRTWNFKIFRGRMYPDPPVALESQSTLRIQWNPDFSILHSLTFPTADLSKKYFPFLSWPVILPPWFLQLLDIDFLTNWVERQATPGYLNCEIWSHDLTAALNAIVNDVFPLQHSKVIASVNAFSYYQPCYKDPFVQWNVSFGRYTTTWDVLGDSQRRNSRWSLL